MAYHKKKQDILAFLTKLDEMLGRYKRMKGGYPPSIPFFILLYKSVVKPSLYVNRPDEIFTHITLTAGIPKKSLYPKISSVEWKYVPSISLENLIAPLIDPGVVYQIAPDLPPGTDLRQYYVPSFIVEEYCQEKWYFPSW